MDSENDQIRITSNMRVTINYNKYRLFISGCFEREVLGWTLCLTSNTLFASLDGLSMDETEEILGQARSLEEYMRVDNTEALTQVDEGTVFGQNKSGYISTCDRR
jgi:hypothetical protein